MDHAKPVPSMAEKVHEWEVINQIVQRGGSVEVKGNKDGSWKILETTKRIVKAS